MTDWLPGVLRLPANRVGGTQNKAYPPRLVLHTTEGGGTVQSLAAFYHGSTYWPHFTADLVRKELAQHLPFSQGGAALSHTTATETNNANCIQVEIIGRAAESPHWPADQVDWLGRALAPCMDALGIARRAPAFVPGGAGLNAPQRMSEASWRAFNGVCGHQHVPENDHWDPGGFDIARFLAAAGGAHPQEENELTPEQYDRLVNDVAIAVSRRLVVEPYDGKHFGVLTEELARYMKPVEEKLDAIAAKLK